MEPRQPFSSLYKKPDDCRLKVKINNVDYYQATPTAFDRNTNTSSSMPQKLYNVPVIRIFGTTETGQHSLVHIHGVFPYLYIEYFGGLHIADGMLIVAHLIKKVFTNNN